MGHVLLEEVIGLHARRWRRKTKRVTLDLDPTHDPTHGAQQLALFNGFYDCWCYQTMLGFLTFDDEDDQYLFTAILQPGTADPRRKTTLGVLRRVIPSFRAAGALC